MKKLIKFLIVAALVLLLVFLTGRHGWRLFGFRLCESAGIETVEVTEGAIRIVGFHPGSFPRGFLGYHAREEEGTLYIGFKFSGLFGIFETGDFDITVPVKGEITGVVIKTRIGEHRGWPREEDTGPDLTEATENGIYIKLERTDVYSVDWYCERESGGLVAADGSALASGTWIALDTGIEMTAENLERPVPFMLTFSDGAGNNIAQASLRFDPAESVVTVTLTADGRLLVNGVELEDTGLPAAYEALLSRYRTALEEDPESMLLEADPETVGYRVEDLDGDGSPELSIGTLSVDEFYAKLIFALYTLDENGEAHKVFVSTERNRYYYAGGVRFANLGASAFGDSYVTTLKLEGRELVDMTFTTDPVDYIQMELKSLGEWGR